MPDFARALKQIDSGTKHTTSWSSQLASYVAAGLAPRWVLPAGEIHSTPFGSHYFTRSQYARDYFHGKVRLERFSPEDLALLMALMREKGQVPDRDRIVFLDTETTGMQGGVGMCPFLIGLGYFVRDEFQMVQYFIRDFDEEPSMLFALRELLEPFELVVTYNGAAFDLPLLESRFTLARLDSPFQDMSHFDLLFTARRLWRKGHGSCRLVALEREMISFLRGPDVPGAMIPRAYFDYLHRHPSPILKSVFSHNVHDVLSLAALTVHACDRVTLEPAALDDPLDLYSLARVFEHSPDWRRSTACYELALGGGLSEPVRQKALENLSVVYRRAGENNRVLAVCQELIQYPEFSMIGYEGAAIFYERVERDYDAAIQILEAALARTDNERWRTLLKNRWHRLQQLKLRL
jgi:uncharacterized protein